MIVKTNPEELQSYLEDPSNLAGSMPEKVLIPETQEDVMQAVKEADAGNIPVTVSGGGTGIVGGRVPNGGWVISLERLNNIKRIYLPQKKARVEAGTVIDHFNRELEASSLFYPPFPTEKNAFIGGTIATNASGEFTYKYGCTREYVTALNVVLPDGEFLSMSRGEHIMPQGHIRLPHKPDGIITEFRSPNLPKNSCGYYVKDETDLVDLFIGSEGTLGIVTEAEIRVIDNPQDPLFCVMFLSEPRALEITDALKRSSAAHRLLGIEYFDAHSLKLLSRTENIPSHAVEAVLIMTDSADDTVLDGLEPILEQPAVITTWASDTRAARDRIYAFRRRLPETINEIVKSKDAIKRSTDIAVPEVRFTEMFSYYTELLEPTGIGYALFGHIGESHLHLNLLPSKEQAEKAESLYVNLLKKGVSLGGTISAEHGIGKKKRKYLPLMFDAGQLSEMKKIKDYIDPKGIMSPGNIF